MYLLTDDYTCDTKVSGEVKAFQISRVVFDMKISWYRWKLHACGRWEAPIR
jgi:hypothetical protein